MLRIMVVDDEPIILKGIKSIIKRRAQDYVVAGEAKSLEEAINTALACRPDVIITDIRMPDGTGLEMIERLLDKLPDTKYVVLSGYGEFEYAQEALRLGVSDYILKPVNSREIYSVLEKMTALFQEKRQSLSRKNAERIRDALYQFFYRNNRGEEGVLRQSLKESCFFTVVLLQLPAICGSEIRQQGIRAAEGWLEKNQTGFVTADGNEICILLQTEKVSDIHFINHFLLEQMKELGIEGSCLYVSDTVSDTDSLSGLFRQAKQCQGMSFYRTKKQQIQRWSGEEMVPFTIDLLQNHVESELCALLEQRKAEEAEEKLRGQMTWCARKMIIPQDVARYFQGLLRLAIAQMRTDGFLPPVLDDILNEQIFSVNDCSSSEELLEKVKVILQELTREDQRTGETGSSRIVQEIKRYIQEHYAENINLNALADQVYLSPKYLSDLFKRETGENYTSYLLYVRMEHAKKYLMQFDLKIYEVAELTGYASPKQFIRVFKKEVGVTPGEYRNQVGNGKQAPFRE